ncbi:MAG TPA: AraC family transcriptional regulator [Pedococcus sp.]|uniref:AraC family transcriptional regulator n=1 Tax=Pedococcus sp. TaxID=2860345 RepID=UPI002F925CBB
MDAITAVLDGPRARDAFVLRCVLSPPWSLRIGDEAPLSVLVVTRGHAWVRHDDTPPTCLTPGDVALVKGPDHYTVADDPDRPPQVLIDTEQQCHDLLGAPLALTMALGVRTWGNAPDGETALLTGSYDLASQLTPRLLDALPRLAVVGAAEWRSPLVSVMEAELGREDTGQAVVLDRLLDLLLIEALRAWFAHPERSAPRWWTATHDPTLGPALRAVHHRPEHPWSVASLASEAGLSRAAFARRFTEVVGETPMAYLTDWRLALAADELRGGDATVAAIARGVGYASPFSLSIAFKRRFGLSPQAFRRAHTADRRRAATPTSSTPER